MAPGQYGIKGRTKKPRKTQTTYKEKKRKGPVPCISEALAVKAWYKTLEMSLPESRWIEQGLVGPGLLCAQMNILVLLLS